MKPITLAAAVALFATLPLSANAAAAPAACPDATTALADDNGTNKTDTGKKSKKAEKAGKTKKTAKPEKPSKPAATGATITPGKPDPVPEMSPAFKELISSVSKQPATETIPANEAQRLDYSVSAGAVLTRQEKLAEKAAMIDPGNKDNGKQSLRIVLARLDKDINDKKALANIITTAPHNGKDAHFTKLMLAHLYAKYHDQFPPKVMDALHAQFPEYTRYLQGFEGGTENHVGMQRIAAAIFGDAYPNDKIKNGLTGRELETIAGKWITDYGRTVFHSSMKEYLSLIYLGVHNEIWLTGAEYLPTEELRNEGAAMCDWIWADLAMNSHLGQTLPPATRAKTMLDRTPQLTWPVTHAQWIAWLYWGDTRSQPGVDNLPKTIEEIKPGYSIKQMMSNNNEGFQTAIVPAVMTNRIPNDIIRNIGAKNISLPYMLLQSRAHGNHIASTANNPFNTERIRGGENITRNHLRSVYVARNYSLSGGYFRADKTGDSEQYKHLFPSSLVYRSSDPLNGIIVSHPYWYAGDPHGNDAEANLVFGLDSWLGKSPFEQSVHWENTMIYLYNIPDEDPEARADKESAPGKWVSTRLLNPLKQVCVYVPETIDETRKTDWGWFLREGDVYVAVRPVGNTGAEWQKCTNPVQVGHKRLILSGDLFALILEVGDAAEYKTPEAFIQKIASTNLDTSALKTEKTVRYNSTRGIPFELQFNEKNWFPKAKIKDVALDYENWPICESPYVTSRDGVLNVNDGRKGFIIDWSGDTPKRSYYNVQK